MKFLSVYFVCTYFFWKEILPVTSTSNYYHGLIKYLKEDSKLHQVVFILNNELNHTNPTINSLMKEINSHFPSTSINYRDFMHFKDFLPARQQFRRTTLFVLQLTNENSFQELNGFIFVAGFSTRGDSLPKVLVVNSFPTNDEFCNKTLQYAWGKRRLLDTTLLKYEYKCPNVLKTCSDNLLLMSQLNPFTKKYTEKSVSSKSEWFPNKLHDLHGYKLYFSYDNETDRFPGGWNAASKFGGYLSQAMNFEFDAVSIHSKQRQEMTLSTYNRGYLANFNVRVLKLGNVKAVILNTTKRDETIVLSPELSQMLLGTISMILIIRLLAVLMRFNNSVWETFNISQIIMGMSTIQEPVNLLERIVFGLILIPCIVYSGYCYSVILDITWRSEPTAISSLNELVDHELPPMADFRVLLQFKVRTANALIENLGQRTLEVPNRGSELDCLQYLVVYQNISSCLIPDAELFVNTYRMKMGELNVKILPETILPYFTIWISDNYSPYLDRFKELILRASEYGILKNFYESAVQLHESSPPVMIKKKTLLLILSYVLVIGYSLSMIAFLIEILMEKSKIFKNVFYRRIRFSN